MNIAVAIDNCYGYTSDFNTLNRVAELLRAKGHTVTTYGRGPNKIQSAMDYRGKNHADVMIQIVCGRCLGTLVDFYLGTGKYYNAPKGAFMYYKCWDANWKAHRSKDDTFSRESDLAPYKGKTLPEIFNIMKDKCSYGYGNNADELVSTWLNNFNGTGNNNTSNNSNGSNSSDSNQPTKRKAKDMIIEAIQDLDSMGVELIQEGDSLQIRKTAINEFLEFGEDYIFIDSVVFNEYDAYTPNVFKDPSGKELRDEYLIQKNGEVIMNVPELNELTMPLNQRDYGHSIDLKTWIDPSITPGRWIKLNLPSFGIKKRMYYLTKLSYNGGDTYNITLEPGPPHRKIQNQNALFATSNKNSNSVAKGKICSAIEKAGGIPITDYKSLYENFKKFKYKFYWQDQKTLDQEISAIQNGKGLNCVDHVQLYYQAYKEAGFTNEIQILNGTVYCRNGSYGHVWCRVKDNGKWVTVDPSAAANHGYDIGRLICASGSVSQVNPSFAVNDDAR